MDGLHGLLAVQELDTQADQLRHRRAHLPERMRLDEVAAELAAVEALVAGYREQVRAHALEQHEAFGDLARRVAELELAIDALAGRDAGPDTELDPGPDAGQGVRARPS